MDIFFGIMIPFAGTTLGAAMVYFFKKEISSKTEKLFLGLSAGVMIAASIWSLIIPSIELAIKNGQSGWFQSATGFSIGMLSLLLINNKLPILNIDNNHPKKTSLLVLAITLHNIPEGMAVGAIFAGFINNPNIITFASALSVAIGVGIQNIPEGAVISLPLLKKGKKEAFLIGFLSGIVEPIFALITVILSHIIVPILPYLLAFAAGAMIYVVTEELIVEIHGNKSSPIGTIGITFGFVIMMILDVIFS